jgi:hypothetical protein
LPSPISHFDGSEVDDDFEDDDGDGGEDRDDGNAHALDASGEKTVTASPRINLLISLGLPTQKE